MSLYAVSRATAERANHVTSPRATAERASYVTSPRATAPSRGSVGLQGSCILPMWDLDTQPCLYRERPAFPSTEFMSLFLIQRNRNKPFPYKKAREQKLLPNPVSLISFSTKQGRKRRGNVCLPEEISDLL